MHVRIYQPAKTAMQSGRANTKHWIVEAEPSAKREIDRLMGWTSSADTARQLRMQFATRDEAIGFCKRHGLMYSVAEARQRRVRPRAYADNFAFNRLIPWTH